MRAVRAAFQTTAACCAGHAHSTAVPGVSVRLQRGNSEAARPKDRLCHFVGNHKTHAADGNRELAAAAASSPNAIRHEASLKTAQRTVAASSGLAVPVAIIFVRSVCHSGTCMRQSRHGRWGQARTVQVRAPDFGSSRAGSGERRRAGTLPESVVLCASLPWRPANVSSTHPAPASALPPRRRPAGRASPLPLTCRRRRLQQAQA